MPTHPPTQKFHFILNASEHFLTKRNPTSMSNKTRQTPLSTLTLLTMLANTYYFLKIYWMSSKVAFNSWTKSRSYNSGCVSNSQLYYIYYFKKNKQ